MALNPEIAQVIDAWAPSWGVTASAVAELKEEIEAVTTPLHTVAVQRMQEALGLKGTIEDERDSALEREINYRVTLVAVRDDAGTHPGEIVDEVPTVHDDVVLRVKRLCQNTLSDNAP